MRHSILLFSILITSLTGCEAINFKPYNYDSNEGPKLDLSFFDAPVSIHGKKLVFKKKLGVPKKQSAKPDLPPVPVYDEYEAADYNSSPYFLIQQ